LKTFLPFLKKQFTHICKMPGVTTREQYNNNFITQKDYDEFKKNDDDLERCIAAFKREVPAFLRVRWQEKYEEEIKKIETSDTPLQAFNDCINFPSWGADAILDDLFTATSDEDLNLISFDSYAIFGYFYGIHLHV